MARSMLAIEDDEIAGFRGMASALALEAGHAGLSEEALAWKRIADLDTDAVTFLISAGAVDRGLGTSDIADLLAGRARRASTGSVLAKSPTKPRPESYGASPIKRGRRTKAQMTDIADGLFDIVERYQPMTVRNAFYRAVAEGLVEKTEKAYKGTVGRLLTEMRRAGRLPYGWITDSTRWQRKPRSFSDLDAALEDTHRTYRRALWREQERNVEVWIEKDAIAGVVLDVTAAWDVPLMSVRGYPSLSFLHSAAEDIAEAGKPTVIFYFGDFDPSGVHIPKKIEADLRSFAPDAELEFRRMAVTTEQIERWNLPTRPTKTTDSRAHSFGAESVEVDAIEPSDLRELVETCITSCIDPDALAATRRVEAAERETLANMIRCVA